MAGARTRSRPASGDGAHGQQPTGAEPRPSPVRRSALERALDGPGWTAVRVTTDLLALWVAVGLTVGGPFDPVSPSTGYALLVFPLIVMALFAVRGTYERRLRVMVLDGSAPVVGAISVAVMVLVMGETYIARSAIAPGVLVHLFLLSILCVHAGRTLVVLWQRWARARNLVGRPTLIIGTGLVAAKIAQRLHDDSGYGLRPVGFLDDDPAPFAARATNLPVLGRPDQLQAVARATGAQHVVMAFSRCSDRSLVPLLRHSKQAGVEVSLIPRLFEAMNDRVTFEAFGGIPVLGLRGTDPLGWRFSMKHELDRTIAAVLLAVLAPLMLALAAAVRLSSPGPVLFRQQRVGRDGNVFEVLKFRSMSSAPSDGSADFRPPEGCGPGGVEGIDRRTRIGRFLRRTSLDELPQLVNVVKGEMSLVGPRPERMEFVEAFRRDIERYGDRHRVKAGITGWAQVHGLRGQTSIADRAEWDNFYIENWSLKLDLRILAMTVLAALRSVED